MDYEPKPEPSMAASANGAAMVNVDHAFSYCKTRGDESNNRRGENSAGPELRPALLASAEHYSIYGGGEASPGMLHPATESRC
jgi:hypothetical protein